MNKCIIWVVCLCLQVGVAIAAPSANKSELPFIAKINVSKLNVRIGPSTSHRIVRSAKKDEQIIVHAIRDGWYQIAYPHDVFVWKKYVTIQGTRGIISGNNINVRDRTDHNRSRVICQLKNGDAVTVVEEMEKWVKIAPPNAAKAWISGKHTQYIAPHEKFLRDKRNQKVINQLLAHADKAYTVEMKRPLVDANFSRIIYAYKKAEKLAESPSLRSSIASKRSKAEHHQALSYKLKKIEKDKSSMALQLKKIEKDYQARVEELNAVKHEKNPTYFAVGWVESVGRYFNRPAPFRLTKGQRVLYFVKSDAHDLDQYAGQYVGIKGEIDDESTGPVKVINVTKIDVLRKKEK